MRNGKRAKKKIAIFLLMIMIAIVFILGSTYSRYLTQVEGKGIIQVAKWAFLVNGETASITNINLAKNYALNNIAQNRIAPGTSGSFDIVIDTTGSEVAIEYDVKFTQEKNKPENLKYQYKEKIVNSLEELEEDLKGTVFVDEEERIKKYTIKWFWPYESGRTEEEIKKKDERDTKDGENAEEYSFEVVVTGRQVEPLEENE